MRLEQKVAIMTGDGTDIGESIAKVFAKQDAEVAIAGRWKDESECVRRDIERKGGQALALPGSVSGGRRL
jgi:NAD(P)-dependent dehydrogenase (short-subunit alcohol dehydrogenase family)